MTEHNPAERFDLVPPEIAAGIEGIDFMRGLLDGSYPAPPFSEVADIWIVAVEPGRIQFEAMPSQRFYNPMGFVHGGWIAMLLDTAMGCVVHTGLTAGQSFTTIELKTAFLRPVTEQTGKLRCEAILLHRGSRVASAEGKIFDAAGKLIAHGSESCAILDLDAARR